jgi:hypothetical protein
MSCTAPIAFERLVEYFARELDDAGDGLVEEHLFSCAGCKAAAEAVQWLGSELAPPFRRWSAPRGWRACATPVRASTRLR